MICVQASIVAAAREERASVGVAALEEGLARGVVCLFGVGVGSLDAALIAEVLAFLVETVGSQGVARRDSPLLSQWRPLALLAWRAVVAQVVDVGEECDARVRGVAHGKGSAEEGWGFRRLSEVLLTAEALAYAALRIREPRRVVVALQSHVHHHLFLCRLLANGALHVVGCPFVASDVLHHVGRHVVEEQLAVAVEEVLAVEQQGIHFAAVHGYLSAAMKLHARQLLDECVEHRAFCHREGIRIIDQRVAVHVELQLSGLHHKLVHDGGGITVQHEALLLCLRCSMQVDGLQFAVAFAFVHLLDLEGSKACLVALCFEAQQVLAHLLDSCIDISVEFVVVFIALHVNSIDETAVGSTEECRLQAVDAVVRQVVSNCGIDVKFPLLRLCRVCLAVSRKAKQADRK